MSPDDVIEELHEFDYTSQKPRPYRPFKTQAHISMGRVASCMLVTFGLLMLLT